MPRKLKYKHDYEAVTPPAFQRYAHDEFLRGTAKRADRVRILTADAEYTPPEKTWRAVFGVAYAQLGEHLKGD